MKQFLKLAGLGLVLFLVAAAGYCRRVDFDRICGRNRVRKYLWGVHLGTQTVETPISRLYRKLVDDSPPAPVWITDSRGTSCGDVPAVIFRLWVTGKRCSFHGERVYGHLAASRLEVALGDARLTDSAKRYVLEKFFAYAREYTRSALDYATNLENWLAEPQGSSRETIRPEDLPEDLR